MRIAFLGFVSACDPMRIGGAESVTRRLASAVSSKGHDVTIILYGALESTEVHVNYINSVRLIYCYSFSDALDKLSEMNCTFVIEMHIAKRDIIRYLIYKIKKKHSIRFSKIFLIYPLGRLRKLLYYWLRAAYCHSVFAISPRLVKDLNKYNINAVWMPPPIPEQYFTIGKKISGDKIRVSYIGRFGDDKGCEEILTAFQILEGSSDIDLLIHGYYNSNNQNSMNFHKAFSQLKTKKYEGFSRKSTKFSFSEESLLLDFLRETDLLVLPYRHLHGTIDVPLLLIEGLVTKCAVLTTNVGDNSFFIENENFVVDVSDDLSVNLNLNIRPEILRKEISRISSNNLHTTFAEDQVADLLLENIRLGLFDI